MKLSHLNSLRALEATLRLGSFSAAAKEIGITPAAVGQRVRALEDYLGRELFKRASTGAVPSAEAQRIQPVLGSGFSAIADSLSQLKAEETPRRLWVTLPESFAENWLSWNLSQLRDEHPGMNLQLDASNRDVDLGAEDFDLAVRYGSQPEEAYEYQPLFGDSVQSVCSPEFARKYLLDATIRDLSNLPLIHVLNRTGDPSWVGFREWGARFGIKQADTDHGVRFSKTSSGLQAAVSGQGLIMAGLVEAYHGLRTGLLTMPFGPGMMCPTTYSYRILWHKRKRLSKTENTFITWLLEQADAYSKEVQKML